MRSGGGGCPAVTIAAHDIARYAVLFAVAFGAGAINSVAGGGTLLTFPTLLLCGVSPITANATNTVALVPGSGSAMWAYRSDIKNSRAELALLGFPSLIGGVIGALWVVRTGDAEFSRLVPWLILGATALFIIQEPLAAYLRRAQNAEDDSADSVPTDPKRRIAIAAFQLLVAIYGGFFGAGMGIMMLAALGLMGFARNIHRANGVKNCAAVCINGVAAATFIIEKRIDWPYAALMAVAAVLGGYGGAGLAKRLGQKLVRQLIVGIGIGIGVYMLYRQYLGQ
jgi:hypothetical protein